MYTSIMHLIDPELFKVYAFWGSILALKLFALEPLTARNRFQKKTFADYEDAASYKGVNYNDADVKRVHRAYLNDLENIPIWYIVTLLWLTTGPSIWLASILIRTFVIARILHTLAYAVFAKQPHRALAFFASFAITLYQAISTLLYYL